VLGGLGNFWGVVVAAMVILVIPEKLQAIQEFRLLIFALLVLGILLFRPAGILPRPIRDLSRFIGRPGVDA
jgi:ABC-type branched-subunit amino acid transport system permease subunit